MKNVMMTNQNSLFTSAKMIPSPTPPPPNKNKNKEALIRYLNHHVKFTFIFLGAFWYFRKSCILNA